MTATALQRPGASPHRTLVPATFDDFREMASRRLPRQLFEFIDGGAFGEETLFRNAADFSAVRLRQKVMRNIAHIDRATTVMGERWAMPLALGPVGLAGMMRRRGEVQAARAAATAGVPFVLSTYSLCSIEEVAKAAARPIWFQLYVMRDRGFVQEMLRRAEAAGCGALVVTVDIPMSAPRYRDVRNGMTGGLGPMGRFSVALDYARKFGWLEDVALRGRPHVFGNLAAALPNAKRLSDFYAFASASVDQTLTWKDIEWLRGQWKGKLVVKGVLDADDAREAAKAGAQGIIVSNHGGRQLDGSPSSIAALPAVVDAVGGSVDVLLDGGVRTGVDIARALALGAKACLIGRPWVFALAAQGQVGVELMLSRLYREFEVVMAHLGCTRVADIDQRVLAAV